MRISDWSSDVCSSDLNGRSYSTLAHSLPSARGNGEPLTGRFSPAAGASFQALATGYNDARFVLASSHGYGFVTRFEKIGRASCRERVCLYVWISVDAG